MLQPEPIGQAEQGQGLGRRNGGFCGDQQHQVQGIEIGRQGGSGRQTLQTLRWMAKALRQPDLIGGLQPRSPQDAAHLGGSPPGRIGQHRQGGGPLLQPRRQGLGIAAVQADPCGVLPGAAQAGEGQLQGGGGRVEAEALGGKVLQQQPTDPEPEGIAAGEQHHPLTSREGLLQPRQQVCGPVTGQQLRPRGAPAPGLEICQQTPGGRHQIGPQDLLLPMAGEARHPGGIGAEHLQQRTLQPSPAPLLAMMLPKSAGPTPCP